MLSSLRTPFKMWSVRGDEVVAMDLYLKFLEEAWLHPEENRYALYLKIYLEPAEERVRYNSRLSRPGRSTGTRRALEEYSRICYKSKL